MFKKKTDLKFKIQCFEWFYNTHEKGCTFKLDIVYKTLKGHIVFGFIDFVLMY